MVKYSTLLGAAGVASAMALPKSLSVGAIARRSDYGNATVATPIPRDQITQYNIDMTPDNVLYSTATSSAQAVPPAPLDIEIVNNFGGGDVSAYLTGTDENGQAAFWLADGTKFNPENPAAGQPPVEIPQDSIRIKIGATGSTTPITLPDYVNSGRIYFSTGDLYFGANNGAAGASIVQPSAANPSDPSAALNWGFTEFTWNTDNLFANISFVDFVGLVIALAMEAGSGNQEVKGLPGGVTGTICSSLKDQAAADGQIWDQLCVVDGSGNPLRVISPNFRSADAFQDYWTQYVDDVYNSFSGSPLTVNTPADGDVTGTFDGTNINFSNGGSFGKPAVGDIFGCSSGPFSNEGTDLHKAIGARMCAAFNRATYKLDGGATQPNGPTDAGQWYGSAPSNYYSKFVHLNEIDGKGYAFSYDDVSPAGQPEVAGTVQAADPTKLTVTIGGVQ